MGEIDVVIYNYLIVLYFHFELLGFLVFWEFYGLYLIGAIDWILNY